MSKPTPNPPEVDLESSERIPSYADIRATPRKLCTTFFVNPDLDTATLLAHACESLASANVMTMDLADRTDGTSRNTLLGIAQVIMLGELAVNRALDRIELSE